MKTNKILNLAMAFIFAFSLVGMPASVSAQEAQSNPILRVNPDGVWGIDWTLGSSVTLTVNDPANGTNVDYTATEIVEMYNFPNPTAVFHLSTDFQIQPNFELTMTDGNIIKTYTVIYLKIMNVDVNNDTVSGVADPGEEIWVWMEGGDRTVITDQNGNWFADFRIPGGWPGEETTFDILPNTFVMSMVNDEDGDGTTDWTEAMSPPVFMLNVNNDSSWKGLDAWNWPLGSQVTLTVDNPNTPQDPDYTEVQTMGQPNDSGHTSHAMFMQDNNFEGHPGFTITLSDGVQTKSMIVSVLRGTEYDLDADTITGVTDPFASVVVGCVEGAEPTVIADSNGNWLANFRDPENPDIVIYDIKPGSWCEPQMFDDDWDHIVLRDWYVPMDTDGDGITDDSDNAPNIFNPDQRDVDSDGTADVLDPCPGDATNTCNKNGSTSAVIGSQGGALAPSNGMVMMNIPAGAMDEFTSLSITDMGGNYEIASNQGTMSVIRSYSIQPHGAHFTQPVSITFHWNDADNNGIIDGTTLQEIYILMIKNGSVISSSCSINPDCDMVADELTVHVSDLSLFALAVPLNQPPVADAGGPYFANEGTTINLSASKSIDPDNSIVLYKWDLDNDGQFDDATGEKPKFKAIDNGIFTVRVRVTDAGGLSSVDSSTVTVKNSPPVITSLTFNSSVRVGVKLNTLATFKDAGVNDTFTAIWKWGDGTTSAGIVNGNIVTGSHTYTKIGIYLVTITVKDKDGGAGQINKLIIVLPKK